ncbi:transporter substrate-binding domain-containing protein [Shewanella canadensis]|uniref:Transporter substrate-binding domain-containing protein n=1 Tax=Shewanella canadensis TaxID=271096 RepID=A0A3S0IQP3_9GAMM|nr:transporter substrate-binding domain-containing protein [Shewanella canadensis]RTR39830.1 transporter substrate-binding domain-containing protein [Shewanella canadensis]
MLVIGSFAVPEAKADTLHLTSLHWPPYSGSTLEKQGATIAITRAAMRAMGHELIVGFFPWSRAIRLVNRPESKYVGYLPAYSYPTDEFIFSDPLGSSPLGLVEQHLHPISWSSLADLNQYRLGVVRDYTNTAELDAMIKLGTQRVEVVNSDEHNVKKVATARIDAAVIDLHVFGYLLSQKELKSLAGKLQINKKTLEDKQMFIAFRNTPEGHYWRDMFNAGLSKIDAELILDEYMSEVKTGSK